MTQFLSNLLQKTSLLLLALVLCNGAMAAKRPTWIKRLPTPENDSYFYSTADASATSEEIALGRAMAQIYRNAKSSCTGLEFDMSAVDRAVLSGKVETLGEQFKIPVRRVCTYRVPLENGQVRVYVLCQVAKSALGHEFSDFTKCGSSGDDNTGAVSMRPSEWSAYETNDYITVFLESDIDKDEKPNEAQVNLEKAVVERLQEKAHINDSSLLQLVFVASHLHNKSEVYAMASIEKAAVVEHYSTKIDVELQAAETLVEHASTYLLANKISDSDAYDASSKLEQAKEKLNQIDGFITFVNAYDPYAGRKMKGRSATINQNIIEKNLMLGDVNQSVKLNKIEEYIGYAKNMLEKREVGNALRYLYAAQMHWAELPNNQLIKHDGVCVNDYVQEQIREILNKVNVQCDGYLSSNKNEYKLSFFFENEPIVNLNFACNVNSGFTAFTAIKDGWGTFFVQEGNKPATIQVMLDYRYEDEAMSQGGLPMLISKYKQQYDYDKYATKSVALVHKAINLQQALQATTAKKSTAIGQNNMASNINDIRHKVSAADSARYHQMVLSVCDMIRNNVMDYSTLSQYMTSKGVNDYKELMENGSVHVITTDVCRFVRVETDVQCRSVPMKFTFSRGKNYTENVVFTIDEMANKIDGICFALDERSVRNIMGDTDINETSRMMLVTFMENYKTAFSMKNWDYIESIFAEDAVIITGRKVIRTGETSETYVNKIKDYELIKQTKSQYIARLKNTKKEWINIKFGNTKVEKSRQNEMYAITLLQDYYSSNYGDHGYLFLLIDANDSNRPLIRVRTWHPESAGATPFTLSDYDQLSGGIIRY